MVVKLSVAAMYADVYPSQKSRGRQMDCAAEKRQKLSTPLPALVEDDSEGEFQAERETFVLRPEDLRRQKSVSPQRRERMRRHLALPSLSEDEEP
ncbi:unnamed protein product [Leptosia nina]|uniref:Uncharacterized protein n=1 Tax=Leptosia nina TaxID=320188 RepID=A0AAV1J0F2_9NEOP